MGYMDDFLSDRQTRKDPAKKYAIEFNRWDLATRKEIESQVRDYMIATNRLTESVETGYEAMSDTLMGLFKAAPMLRDGHDMRPSYLINHAVMEEALNLREMDDARQFSVGDPVATGLSAAELEPELEILFDKMEKAREQAAGIEQMLQQMEQGMDDLDDIMEQLEALGESSEEREQAKNWQEQKERIEEQLEQLRQQIEDDSTDLMDQIDMHRPFMKDALEKGLGEAKDSNEVLSKMDSWGLSPGSLRRMDPRPRMQLAQKLKTEKFRRVTEIIGRMQNVATTAQTQRAEYAVEEVYDIEQGADLRRLIPTELLALGHPILRWDFLHRFVEQSLLQYALHGNETVNRGGILSLTDSSSSMHGERHIWSKAISLALLKIAKTQRRKFTAIEFAGPGLYVEYHFDTSRDELMLRRRTGKKDEFFYGLEAIVTFAEDAMGGGTCFMTPFSRALDLMRDEHSTTGATESDIVFLTDGQAGVSEDWFRDFKEEQERLGFKVFGVVIGGHVEDEPINSICDGHVTTIQSLTNENDMRPVFGAVGG